MIVAGEVEVNREQDTGRTGVRERLYPADFAPGNIVAVHEKSLEAESAQLDQGNITVEVGARVEQARGAADWCIDVETWRVADGIARAVDLGEDLAVRKKIAGGARIQLSRRR